MRGELPVQPLYALVVQQSDEHDRAVAMPGALQSLNAAPAKRRASQRSTSVCSRVAGAESGTASAGLLAVTQQRACRFRMSRPVAARANRVTRVTALDE